MALCCLLAFWTRGDAEWMDSLFRDSGLLRPKWDEVHYADGSTYGAKTIQRAIGRTSEFYEPEANTDSSTSNEPDSTETSTGHVGSGRVRQRAQTSSAYLEEQNRLLRQRVCVQEATIERQADHIEELKTELDALRTTLADREEQLETSTDRPDSSSTGILNRVRRRLLDDSTK
jgi:primase-polymerase (primpol)-like protein